MQSHLKQLQGRVGVDSGGHERRNKTVIVSRGRVRKERMRSDAGPVVKGWRADGKRSTPREPLAAFDFIFYLIAPIRAPIRE